MGRPSDPDPRRRGSQAGEGRSPSGSGGRASGRQAAGAGAATPPARPKPRQTRQGSTAATSRASSGRGAGTAARSGGTRSAGATGRAPAGRGTTTARAAGAGRAATSTAGATTSKRTAKPGATGVRRPAPKKAAGAAGPKARTGRGASAPRRPARRLLRRRSRRLRIDPSHPRRRARFLFGAVLAVLVVFAGQLFHIQAFDAASTRAAALSKRSVTQVTPAMRGDVLDTNGQVLAQSVERFTITADPVAIPEYAVRIDGRRSTVGVTRAAADLAPLLQMDIASLTRLFTKADTRYVIVKKNVNPTTLREINALGIPGIHSERTALRVYPTGMTSAQIVGFVQQADQSAAGGVEYLLDSTLAGTPGGFIAERGRDGVIIPGTEREHTAAVNGRDVRLTIDADLQWYAQNVLAKQVTATSAASGTVVVLETATGKIRAAASYPTFDPGAAGRYPAELRRNLAFNDAFEPGSTGKLMTMAAALEEGVVTPDTGVIVPNRLPRADHRFKDHEDHGTLSFTATGVLAQSSNIGTILVGERVPPATMERYYRAFGVGARTPVGFPGESEGELAPADDWDAAKRYTVLFGQGYSVTAVQAAGVFQTIANGGLRIPPTLVEGTVNDSGTFVPTPGPAPVRVVSEETATTLSRMLEEVTGENGTASDARIEGFRVAGKTGTANRYDEKRGGYHGYTASFIGYAPAEDAPYVVAVVIQDPKTAIFGGMIAGPVFNDVTQYLLHRDNVAPSTESALDLDVYSPTPLSDSDPTVLSDAQAHRDGL